MIYNLIKKIYRIKKCIIHLFFIRKFSRNKRNENKIIPNKKKRELTQKKNKNSRKDRNIENFNFNEAALFHRNVPFPFLFRTSRFKITFFSL